jgi:hypothetical protein
MFELSLNPLTHSVRKLVQHMTYFKLEQEISKMAYALMTRNAIIGSDLITDLRSRFSLEEVAGILIVSLERLIWFDKDAFIWAVESLVPTDVMQEIEKIISTMFSKRLIDQGFVPGKDFSVGLTGNLMLSQRARLAVFGS